MRVNDFLAGQSAAGYPVPCVYSARHRSEERLVHVLLLSVFSKLVAGACENVACCPQPAPPLWASLPEFVRSFFVAGEI